MPEYNSVYAECPYYVRAREKFIECTGLYDNTTLVTRFRTEAKRKEHEKKYCDSYPECFKCKAFLSIDPYQQEQ